MDEGTGTSVGDASGNSNTGTISGATWEANNGKPQNSSEFTWTSDTVAPTMTITASNGTNAVTSGSVTADTSLTLTFTSNEATADFNINKIGVSGGTLSNFTASSATVYTATLMRTSNGSAVTVSVDAGRFTDATGNANTATSEFTWTSDNIAPAMTITASNGTNAVTSGSVTADTSLTLTFTSSEATADFVMEDITVNESTLSNFTASSTTVYTATLTPKSTKDEVSVKVEVNTFTDAGGNGNSVVSQFRWTSNGTPKITAISDKTTKEDESIAVVLSATDAEGDAITFSATPDTTLIVSVSSDTLTINPKLNWHGVASVIVYASDGYSKDSTSFDVTVTPVNDLPTAFEWVSGALDTIYINKTNIAETYTLVWTTSTDEADGDTIDYLIYAQIGVHPPEDIYDTTSTSYSISYEDFAEGAFDATPGNAATVRFSVYAHDGTDSVKVTGDDRVVYVNRYDYLSTRGEGIPTEFALHDNYPKPFNPSTTLRFDLPELSNVNVIIYNMLGQKVKTFNMQSTPAGYHALKWNATNDYGDPVGAGVYLYQLQTKDFVKTRKMVLLK